MADTALKLVLLGQDRTASKAIRGVGNEAGRTHGKLGKLGGMGKAALFGIAGAALVAGKAAIDFGGDSIKAFADADKAQSKLEDAYKRFPKVQNVSIESMRKYNQELQRKTGADADDLAASQATLAMFKLNGKQIKDTTPLLIDYANKTGKSLPDSAKVMGKALLGNTKALKDMGITYKSTGDPAKDYANIMGLLKDKVGGYTKSLPEAEQKQKILAASFGDLQESIGEKLQPAMLGLVDAGQGVIDWLGKNPEVAAGASAAFDLVGGALGGLWDLIRKFVLPGLAFLTRGFGMTVDGARYLLEALGNVPGFEWAKGAAKQLGEVKVAIDAIAGGMDALSKDPPVVNLATEKAKKRAKELDEKIKGIKDRIVTAKAKKDDKQLKELEKQLKAAEKKKHSITVDVKWGAKPKTLKVGTEGRVRIGFASGHQSAPAGLAWVGESGPELAEVAQGSRLLSNGQSRALSNQVSGQSAAARGGISFIQHVHIAPGADLRELGKVTEKALIQVQADRAGRPFTFKTRS